MLNLKNKELETSLNNAIALFKELETNCPDAIKRDGYFRDWVAYLGDPLVSFEKKKDKLKNTIFTILYNFDICKFKKSQDLADSLDNSEVEAVALAINECYKKQLLIEESNSKIVEAKILEKEEEKLKAFNSKKDSEFIESSKIKIDALIKEFWEYHNNLKRSRNKHTIGGYLTQLVRVGTEIRDLVLQDQALINFYVCATGLNAIFIIKHSTGYRPKLNNFGALAPYLKFSDDDDWNSVLEFKKIKKKIKENQYAIHNEFYRIK